MRAFVTLFSLSLLTQVFAMACAKKVASTTEEEEETLSPEGSITINTGNTLAISGQLNVSLAAALSGSANGLILFALDGHSKLWSAPQTLTVAEDGSFQTTIERGRLDKIKLGIVDGAPNRVILKEIYPTELKEIDSASDAELVTTYTAALADSAKYPNFRYALAAYKISGQRAAEAQSMQFIGMPAGARDLKLIPGEYLLGDINLGIISTGLEGASSSLTADDALDLPSTVIEELAGSSQTLNFLKNSWMNPDKKAIVTPWFGYKSNNVSGTLNKFTTPSQLTYSGGGYTIAPYDIGATWVDVCPENLWLSASHSSLPFGHEHPLSLPKLQKTPITPVTCLDV